MASAEKLFIENNGGISFSWNDDKRSIDLIKLVREGIPYPEFAKILDFAPFTAKEWAKYLNISSRTLERHREERKVFRQQQSERIVSIYQLLHYGRTVFENQEHFYTWMDSVNIAFGRIRPKDLLDTSIGIDMVRDELGRIQHGVLA
ncbi:type II RES/Xre toxin-antitoxin system antitoxin [Robiginitalea aurantiaca]|uniref:DUF2384 domain-containing protein n=1 Tax=Robiginitalea aurantiaca TaxID=3056915 RepID=A0ABT7WDM1_9FLAO|nr:antitoxin Xre/MbcA/ParS toxin-binding domain-containing protein [Robiginitalea aurantiaca]MDM9630909.1 DUF2384 domain-containing protein [Robiginitalea aurantiaca]